MQYSYKKYQYNIIKIIILLTTIGLIDSLYLSIKKLTKAPVTCSISGGCNDVLNSIYASMFNIPLVYLGIFFYFSMLLLAIFTWKNKSKIWHKLLSIGGLAGFIMSIYFIYLQIFEIGSICQYCMLSACTSTLIFIFSTIIYLSNNPDKSKLS